MTTAPTDKKRRGVLREEFSNPERRTAYYMILPTVFIILVVAFYPILYSLVLSVTDSNINVFGSFVGLENYVNMFQNVEFREGLVNTVVYTVISVFFEFIIGLAIALAINRAFRGRGLVRAAVLVPWAFPTVISAVMWRLMFQDQVGVINYVANAIGLISEPILSDRTLLLIAAILVVLGPSVGRLPIAPPTLGGFAFQMLVGLALFVPLIIWDRRTQGHVHAATWLALGMGAVTAFVPIALIATQTWAPIARHLPGI